ncbi:cupin domain-containing protein [Streptomyces sp. NPDC055722]
MTARIRRLVVAGGESGKDATLDDQARAAAVESAAAVVHELVEIDAAGTVLPGGGEWHHDPAVDGAILRIVTLAPVGADVERPLHASPTVDIGVVLSGAVELALPDGVVSTLTAGDSFVLRGIEHSWTNRGPADCELAVVLTKPSRWE